ncbi:hypothetical protein [Roseovarius sp. Pro17]|uniref:hypothetical protein n=1 Tax=Roseovarius sp. Pro17 TaxID=3108175 RepID=UPI002D7780D5|nr:hypothetical protein [Roseovarius sp. Pro17]
MLSKKQPNRNQVLFQAFGRGRGLNRTAQNLLEVHILADVDLPLVRDCIAPWDSFQTGIFQRMLLEGAAVDSASDAFALYPEMFSSLHRQSRHFEGGYFRVRLLLYIRDLTPKSARYCRTGRGRSWQRAWWIAGDGATASGSCDW